MVENAADLHRKPCPLPAVQTEQHRQLQRAVEAAGSVFHSPVGQFMSLVPVSAAFARSTERPSMPRSTWKSGPWKSRRGTVERPEDARSRGV